MAGVWCIVDSCWCWRIYLGWSRQRLRRRRNTSDYERKLNGEENGCGCATRPRCFHGLNFGIVRWERRVRDPSIRIRVREEVELRGRRLWVRDASAVFSWFEFRYCSLLGIVFRMFGRGEVCLGVGWERPAELWSERWRFKILRLLVHSRNGTIMLGIMRILRQH